MDEKKMFKISCILFIWGIVGCFLCLFGDYDAFTKVLGVLTPFLMAGIPYGWVKSKSWKLPFTLIVGPLEFVVMVAVRLVLCEWVGAPLFIGAAIKHFTGSSKDE